MALLSDYSFLLKLPAIVSAAFLTTELDICLFRYTWHENEKLMF